MKLHFRYWRDSAVSPKRIFDATFASLLIVLLSFPLFVIALMVKMTSRGPVLHWSKRVGKDNKLFLMPKFRSMHLDAPQLPTHLMKNPDVYLTPIGKLLRKTSLDELPQLFSVLQGHLSLVGPRPALFNQDDLTALRTECGVHKLTPGLTGLAQVNGRDELPIPEKVQFDREYLQRQSFKFDLQIMMLTIVMVICKEGIRH